MLGFDPVRLEHFLVVKTETRGGMVVPSPVALQQKGPSFDSGPFCVEFG